MPLGWGQGAASAVMAAAAVVRAGVSWRATPAAGWVVVVRVVNVVGWALVTVVEMLMVVKQVAAWRALARVV